MQYDKLISDEIKLNTLITKKPHYYGKPIKNKILFYSIALITVAITCLIVSSILIYYIKQNKTQSTTIASLCNELNDLKLTIRDCKYKNTEIQNELMELKEKQLQSPLEIHSLLSSNDEIEFIHSLFPGKTIRLITLYQARIDGCTQAEFQKNLQGVPLLLIIVELKSGVKIGGYVTSLCETYFSSSGIYSEKDTDAFLFSITNKKVYNVIGFSHAKHCRSDYLFCFNADLMIHDRCLGSYSSSEFPRNYNTHDRSANKLELTNGESEFDIKDIEVLKVIFK